MTIYDPMWTDIVYKPGGGRDALGVETLSEAILADLLPGINNQTRRARYYSFWAWVLRDFIRNGQVAHTQSTFYTWLRRREDTLILAYLAHGCESGTAGTTKGSGVWQGGEPASFPIDWKSLESVNGGAYQLYYRGALQEMNIIVIPDDGAHDQLTQEVGLKLADAYAGSVASTDYVQSYPNATRLSKPVIEGFAQQGCLCLLPQHDAERRALIDSFFRFDSPDTYAVKRLASLSFFLDVIDQANGVSLSERDMRAVLYFWSYGNQHAYVPVENLLSPAQRWRVFQMRQYFVFALESLWGIFLQRINEQAVTGTEYLAALLSEFDLARMAETANLGLEDYNPDTLTLEAFYNAVKQSLPPAALDPGPTAMETSLNEHRLSEPLWRRQTVNDVQIRVGNALLMLALIYWRCQSWRELPGWHYVSDRYAEGRLPLDAHLRHVQTAIQEQWSLSQWITWLHQHYLWLQHRRVTLEKLISRDQETELFQLVDFEHYGTMPDNLNRETAMLGIGLDSPKMNGPRFPSALNILSDLALIESTNDAGYQLTADGEALLAQFRAYVVPEWREANTDEATGEPEATAG